MSRPKITDNDRDTISVTLDGAELQSWFYGNDNDRGVKVLHAHYFCDGFLAGQGERKIEPEEIAQEPSAAEIRSMKALYDAIAAGLLDSREEYEAKLRDAGRGHLIGN